MKHNLRGMIINTVNKICSILLAFFIICGFSACGCSHEWQEATCTEPKTCSRCGETEGEALGHDYVDGYCTRCYEEDPDYVNLNNLGFSNTYGMDAWLDISGYDFSENRVLVERDFRFLILCGNYWQYGKVPKEEVKYISTVSTDSFDSVKTEPYKLLSNDVLEYNGATGWGPVTIIERVVSSDNKKMIIKTQDETTLSGSREDWFVPADLLDFSTVTLVNAEEHTYYISYK